MAFHQELYVDLLHKIVKVLSHILQSLYFCSRGTVDLFLLVCLYLLREYLQIGVDVLNKGKNIKLVLVLAVSY